MITSVVAMNICGARLIQVHYIHQKSVMFLKELPGEHVHIAGAVKFKYPKAFPQFFSEGGVLCRVKSSLICDNSVMSTFPSRS